MLLIGCGKKHPQCPEDYACQFPNGTIIEDYKPKENDTDSDGKCVPKGNCITKFVGRYHDPSLDFNAPNYHCKMTKIYFQVVKRVLQQWTTHQYLRTTQLLRLLWLSVDNNAKVILIASDMRTTWSQRTAV